MLLLLSNTAQPVVLIFCCISYDFVHNGLLENVNGIALLSILLFPPWYFLLRTTSVMEIVIKNFIMNF